MRQSVAQTVAGPDRGSQASLNAAHRPGHTLDSWPSTRTHQAGRPEGQLHPPETVTAIVDDLQTVAKKFADVSRKAGRDLDMETAAEQDRRVREAAEKTAAALDTVAHWTERSEGRLNDPARPPSDGHERTAAVLNDALSLVTRRLDDIERRLSEGPPPSVDAALTAVQRIEAQVAKLGQDERGQGHAQIEAALRAVEERIAQISERIAYGPHRPGRGTPDPRAELMSAIEEIRLRQSELENATSLASGRAGRDPAIRPQMELLRSLRDDFARLAGQLDVSRASPEGADATAELRGELGGLRQAIGELATRQDIIALERAIRDLAGQMNQARTAERDLSGIAEPLATVQADVRRLADMAAADLNARAALDFGAISRKLDNIAEQGASPALIERLSGELADVRNLLKEIADPQRVRTLAEQVAGLNHQVAQVRRQFGNSDLPSLASAVEEIRTAVASQPAPEPNDAVLRELERLSGRVEGALVASGNPTGVELLMERLDRLNENLGRPRRESELKPIEDMLRALTRKVEEAERSGGNLEGLERQVAALAERLGAAPQPVLSSIERSMGDLLAQMEGLRSGTAAAAERAVKSAIVSTLETMPKAMTGADLETLLDELTGLKAAHKETGKRTQDSLSAVHLTLDKMVSRLAVDPDHDSDGAELTAMQSAQSPKAPARAADAASVSKQLQQSLKQLEAELLAIPSETLPQAPGARGVTGTADVFSSGHEEAHSKSEANSLAGRAASPAGAPGPDGNDIKASFIAAARRAAQAASEAADGKDKGPARGAKSALHGDAGASRGGIARRIKRMLDERRRPILLGFAAVVLALGALQVGANRQAREPSPPTVASPRIEAKVAVSAAPSPPRPTPAKDPIAKDPVVDPVELVTTEAIPSSAPVLPSEPQPQPFGEMARREHEAALIEAKSAARFDPPKPVTNPEAPEALASAPIPAPPPRPLTSSAPPERIPNMASVGPIPATAGPPGLRQAALAGDPAAVYELAARAADGRGMTRDLALAARLFEKAAAHGLVPAQYRTGNVYEKGLGVTRDLATAKSWYQRAAERGNAGAMHNLAVLIAEGAIGKPDYATAVVWFRRAAQHGIRDSQFNLAVLLARGLGAPQDLAGAYTWFAVVAAQGDEDAAKKRDEIGTRLAPAELRAARLAAERWKPEMPDKLANEVSPPPQGWSEAPAKQRSSNGRG